MAGGSTATPQRPTATAIAPTATPIVSPCAANAGAAAEAWANFTQNPQVLGSINGGPDATLSNFIYPLGLPNESNDHLSAIAWAPDAKHLAVVVTVFQAMEQVYYPYIVDTTTHVVTRVTLPQATSLSAPNEWNPWRLLAWADNSTLLIFAAGSSGGSEKTVSYRYDLNSGTVSPLLGVTSAAEGVVHSSLLFYLDLTPVTQLGSNSAWSKGSALLHRYDLNNNTEIGAPVRLGDTWSGAGYEGGIDFPGWDVSPDGAQIAYQQTSASLDNNQQLVTTSNFLASNADGSNAVQILTGAIATSPAFLAISPDGRLVAVTNAMPTPTVLSGSISGGPAHFYQPDAGGPPIWLGSTLFEADLNPGSGGGIERWAVNSGGGRAQGCIAHQNSGNPATLP